MNSKYLYAISYDIDDTTLNEININSKDDFVWTNLKMYTNIDELYSYLKILYKKISNFKFCNFRIARYIILNQTFCFDSYIQIDMDKIKAN